MDRIVVHSVLETVAEHMYLQVWGWAGEGRFAGRQGQVAICCQAPRQ